MTATNLSGKRALITGASGALGAAIAQRLARDGATVLLHASSRPEAVEQLAESIKAAGGSAECHVFDLRSDEGTAAGCAAMLQGGPVQIIVNNAGVHDDAVLPGMRAEQWHKVIDVSLNGFFRVTQPLLLPMLRTRWGRILNVSSVASLMGNRGQVNYAAAKAGLIGATRALAQELASRGITVNAVAPGVIDSPMLGNAFPPERIKQLVPAQRAGTAEEIAGMVAYLVSDAAAYVTGQVVSINGGIA
jgi:3-oxoacyl-[acyl-carrier protein] reductase